jgi:hypothetical protein
MCIDNLFVNLIPIFFANKVLHLKSREGEERLVAENKIFCDAEDIRVIETKEEYGSLVRKSLISLGWIF